MEKKLKQRKIRKYNRKQIIQFITIILIIILLGTFFAVKIINKENKKSVLPDDITSTQEDRVQNLNEKDDEDNLTDSIIDNADDFDNAEEKDDENNSEENAEDNELFDDIENLEQDNNITDIIDEQLKIENENSTEQGDFSKADLAICGIQRGMDKVEVKNILGSPETIEEEYENIAGYTVERHLYHKGTTIIEFAELYEEGVLVVHKITTFEKNAILMRNIRIGMSRQEIENKFKSESILQNDAEMMVIGYEGEDPIYATSDKGKIYFYFVNDELVQASISIGSEV